MLNKNNIANILALLTTAGKGILEYYHDYKSQVHYKADGSPVTEADLYADSFIRSGLTRITPDWPIISEETPFDHSQDFETFWLLDPLDGTKEFIQGNKEFAILLALIHQNTPVWGMIHVPCLAKTYFIEEQQICLIEHNKKCYLPLPPSSQHITLLTSRQQPEDPKIIEALLAHEVQINHTISVGSGYKFGLLVEGKGQLYARSTPSPKSWDLAAGDALLRHFGGGVYDIKTKKLVSYTSSSATIPAFYARLNKRG